MSSTAHAAHPILASTLYDIHLASSNTDTSHTEYEPPRTRRRLATGFKALDREVLDGGLVYGEGGLVCLSVAGESGGGAGGTRGGGREDGSGTGEDVGEEFAYSTLASHLLSTSSTSAPSPLNPNLHPSNPSTTTTPTNPAFLIDPLGTFSPSRLHTLLCSRLRTPEFTHQGGYVYSTTTTTSAKSRPGERRGSTADGDGDGDGVSERAASLLDRVRIMRVFDFSGVLECVGEIGVVLRGLEEEGEQGQGIGTEGVGTDRGDDVGGGVGVDARAVTGNGEREGGGSNAPASDLRGVESVQKQTTGRHEIADSQAEDFFSSSEEDEDDNNTATTSPPKHPSPQALTQTHVPQPQPHHQPPPPPCPHPHPQPTSTPALPTLTTPHALILLPSLPRLLSPLMHHNHVRGHALLIHLLRALRHLTSAHSVCVVVLNGVVGVPVPVTGQGTGQQAGALGVGVLGDEEDEANVEDKPKRGFEQHRKPTTTSSSTADTDSLSIFASNGALRPALGKAFAWGLDVSLMVSVVGGHREGGGVRVVEVVSDRFEGRAGRWCEI